jgi:hypothetical protein
MILYVAFGFILYVDYVFMSYFFEKARAFGDLRLFLNFVAQNVVISILAGPSRCLAFTLSSLILMEGALYSEGGLWASRSGGRLFTSNSDGRRLLL